MSGPSRFIERDQHGNEVDWIDPIEHLAKYDDHYMVDNGHYTYRVDIVPGHTYEILEAWS